jgi:hypothetical protein
MSLEFDTSDLFTHLVEKDKRVLLAMVTGMEDAVDDLRRISTDIAPIDKGILRASAKTSMRQNKGGIVGEVSFSAVENSEGYGRFNYALWTHEADYNLGEQSKAAPGTDGYSVGNKYLERPLKGERDKYVKWWQDEINKALD